MKTVKGLSTKIVHLLCVSPLFQMVQSRGFFDRILKTWIIILFIGMGSRGACLGIGVEVIEQEVDDVGLDEVTDGMIEVEE